MKPHILLMLTGITCVTTASSITQAAQNRSPSGHCRFIQQIRDSEAAINASSASGEQRELLMNIHENTTASAVLACIREKTVGGISENDIRLAQKKFGPKITTQIQQTSRGSLKNQKASICQIFTSRLELFDQTLRSDASKLCTAEGLSRQGDLSVWSSFALAISQQISGSVFASHSQLAKPQREELLDESWDALNLANAFTTSSVEYKFGSAPQESAASAKVK